MLLSLELMHFDWTFNSLLSRMESSGSSQCEEESCGVKQEPLCSIPPKFSSSLEPTSDIFYPSCEMKEESLLVKEEPVPHIYLDSESADPSNGATTEIPFISCGVEVESLDSSSDESNTNRGPSIFKNCSENGDFKKKENCQLYYCFHCYFTSSHKYRLKLHIMTTHTDQKENPPSSSKDEKLQKGILNSQALAKSTDEQLLFCSHCAFKTFRSRGLSVHISAKHKHVVIPPHACPHCDYKTVNSRNLRRHITAIHTLDRPYACPHCDYRSASQSRVKLHFKAKHTDERPYWCSHCEYRTLYPSKLKIHMNAKHPDKFPTSPLCEYKTDNLADFKSLITPNPTKIKPHPCPHCDFRTVYKGDLKNHIRGKHSHEKHLSCPYCGYRTFKLTNLKYHITVRHTDDRPHCCPHCDYRTAIPRNLSIHTRAKHSTERPHSCFHCDYRTAVFQNLKRHVVAKHSDY